jgi:cysteine desulfurase / selenocysteine lyase
MDEIRAQFPILNENVHGKRIAYLDSAASSQVPVSVLHAFAYHYAHDHANIHRGAHTLAERSTQKYEDVREKVAGFIGATPGEIIFTKGTTEGINLIAYTLLPTLKPGDEIVVTEMDHHSNFVMWQQLAQRYGLVFKVIPITPDYRLDMESAHKLITEKTKLVAIPHISNVLGTVNPVAEIARFAHNKGALLLVDGAQAVAHLPVDVKKLEADFYSFSGHKMYAPTGVGVLYIRRPILDELPPFHFGGGMIEEVSNTQATFQAGPAKFEAGTPNIAGVACLGAAIDFIQSIGFPYIMQHEEELTLYALEKMKTVTGIAIIGPHDMQDRSGVISFITDNIHAHDVASILDAEGVAVRGGHHCAQPLANRYDIPATARVSFAVYSTKDDVDQFIAALKKAQTVFA